MTIEEVKEAMTNFSPVKYEGIVYNRITAITRRIIEDKHKEGLFHMIYQVELLDKNKWSVVIANPEKVELIK